MYARAEESAVRARRQGFSVPLIIAVPERVPGMGAEKPPYQKDNVAWRGKSSLKNITSN
jgi:hypothetical protein